MTHIQEPLSEVRSPLAPETADAELARRAAGGEQAAFAVIMRRHNQRLFRTARSILKSDADAEDALQEAYLRAWRALDGFRAEARLSTWLVRIVVNEALGRLRRRHVAVTSLDEAMSEHPTNDQAPFAAAADRQPEQVTARTQLRQLIESRIDRLPEDFRTVFMLRAVEGMSAQEVAESLDIPAATVRTRCFRARRLMREALAEDFDRALDDAFGFDGARCDRIVAGVLARGRAAGLCAGGDADAV